ncbi:hypothetical protein HYT23_05105 [Candidatus Pacearchaeota archaeon]|nr:hypothetical protein [Candidatus Pacearchaeota archaeon]
MELGETELAEDAWRNIYDGSIKAVNTLRDPSLKYEKLKIALNAAVYARMPIEVTSKLRRDITDHLPPRWPILHGCS